MFSMCSEPTPGALIPDTRIPQLMQPWSLFSMSCELDICWCAKGRMNVVLSNSIAFIIFGLFNFDRICFIKFWLNLFCDL